MNVLVSYKTTVVGVLMLVVAGLKMAGIEVPGFPTDVGTLIMGGIAAIFAKDASVTGVVK